MQLMLIEKVLISCLVFGIVDTGRLPTCPTTCTTAVSFERSEPRILTCLNDTQTNVSRICDTAEILKTRSRTKSETFQQWRGEITGLIHKARTYVENLKTKKEVYKSQVVLNGKLINLLERRKVANQDLIDQARWTIENLQDRCSQADAPTPCPKHVTGTDCAEIYTLGGSESGMYVITVGDGEIPKLVYCDQETDGGGWTYIQRHVNNDVDFNKDWIQYQHGFGAVDCDGRTNFWLGNEAIHTMTSQSHQYMRVDVSDWDNNSSRYALYTHFRVGSKATDYTLTVGGYQADPRGDIGDAFSGFDFGHPEDIAITRQHGMRFTTRDHDRDNFDGNCAKNEGGGWWYNRCSAVNLNGKIYEGGVYNESATIYGFDNGLMWGPWRGEWYSLKQASMKIRPASFMANNTDNQTSN
uniref:fibrinogen-like protein 1 isoform X1 n=1 Tax=Ciona intestinalis TaxID=7719 RepID=UPI000EF51D6A|nr:fibrinogen-like protein 1 isoform X1 [Ciona intestinalis]|eukprot:XP_026693347.1 fibrinogen-like protein 1 isoform X1 [Ciona intestinalis]